MAGALSEFLAALPARQHKQTDCLIILADWILVKRGIDPAKQWRGTYQGAREYRAVLKQNAGIRSLVSKVLQDCGIAATDKPEAGDIALVMAPAKSGRRIVRMLVGAICVGPDEWAVLTPDKGLVTAPASVLRPVAIWKI